MKAQPAGLPRTTSLRVLSVLLVILCAATPGIAAGKNKQPWRIGRIIDGNRARYYADLVKDWPMPPPSQTAFAEPSGRTPVTPAERARQISTNIVVEGADILYVTAEPLTWRFAKGVHVPATGTIQYSTDGGELHVLDEADKEHVLTILREIRVPASTSTGAIAPGGQASLPAPQPESAARVAAPAAPVQPVAIAPASAPAAPPKPPPPPPAAVVVVAPRPAPIAPAPTPAAVVAAPPAEPKPAPPRPSAAPVVVPSAVPSVPPAAAAVAPAPTPRAAEPAPEPAPEPVPPPPAPLPPPRPTGPTGTIDIESTPPGADVELDHEPAGKTPATLTMPRGLHDITVSRNGFLDWHKTMFMGETDAHITAVLEPDTAPKQ